MKSRDKIISSLLLVMLLSSSIHAQEPSDDDPLLILGARFHRSFIIQHTDKLRDEITATNPWILETELAWHLRKKDVWSYCYCYPRAGFSLRYINFDLPEILGSSVAAYAFIEPYIRAEHNLNFSIRFGLGPAYLTKIHDDDTNPDNLFFGSPLSFIAVLNLGVNYRYNDQLTFRLAGDYNHISNGGYAEPNLGMNFPSVNLGIDYAFKDFSFPDREKEDVNIPETEKNRLDFSYGISFKPPSYNIREGLYPVHAFGLNYSRTVGRIFALSAGAEWINNRSLKALVEITDRRNDEGEYLDHNRLGALAGIEWLFGRFIFSQHFGYYLYSPVEPSHSFYQRYGLLFRIKDYLFTGVSVKAHAQDADFIDLRVGVSL